MTTFKRTALIKSGKIPTPERRRHNGGVYAEIIHRDAKSPVLVKRYRAVWECPLDAYRDLGVITKAQHRAGLKFRRIYYASVMCRAANDRMGPVDADLRIPRLKRVLNTAYRRLPFPHREAVIDACGHNLVIIDLAKLERLKRGLDQLVELWRMTAQEVCGHADNRRI